MTFTDEECARPQRLKVVTPNETLVWDREIVGWRLWRREHGRQFNPCSAPYLGTSYPDHNRRRALS